MHTCAAMSSALNLVGAAGVLKAAGNQLQF